jgi:hypothetical protein
MKTKMTSVASIHLLKNHQKFRIDVYSSEGRIEANTISINHNSMRGGRQNPTR